MARSPVSPGAADTRELRDAGCGQRVGRYTLLRRIAQGGMAEVYSARFSGEAGLSKRVAIKKILPQYSHNERFISMLLDEAKITVDLDHPNIAQVHELGRDGEDYFIVMEYVDGRPLNKLMQRVDERGHGGGVIPVEHACHILSQVALGLHYAHAQTDPQGNTRNIVHRDVSPQNILISNDGHVKLIDFGIARAEGRLNQTNVGVIKGKLRYLAPEIAAGMEPDARADVFCCGIVLFEMLTGEAMFAPKSDLEAIELATKARVKSPRSRNRRVPQDLDDIVMKALERDRADRYASARDLYADLRRFLNHAFPAFVDSDLGDLVRDLFALEIREERQLDDIASRVAGRPAPPPPPFVPDVEPATGPMPAPASASSDGYRQLVTRIGISAEEAPSKKKKVRLVGADGGDAMDVVVADSGDRPLAVKPGALDGPGTLPPQDAPGRAAEPTVKAQNPFVADVSGTPPPITGPTARPRAETMASSDALVEAGAAADPSLTPVEPSVATQTSLAPGSPPSRRRAGLLLLLAGGIALGSGAVLWSQLDDGPPPDPGPAARAEAPPAAAEPEAPLPPEPPAPATGRLVLDVEPAVPVSVTVSGVSRADREMPPILVDGLAAGEAHAITLSADGYRSITIERAVQAGRTLELNLQLVAALGSIELEGLGRGDRVVASAGTVQGHRIVDIPPDTKVSVKVIRAGARNYRTTVHVTAPRPKTVRVPKPRSRPRGTLVVNTRPVSTVYVDGRRRGRTPVKVRLTAGRHKIRLEGPGDRTFETARSVRAGKTTHFQFAW